MTHPRMYDESSPQLQRLRTVCLALPDVHEKEAWGECTFRVTGGSMFAMTDTNHHDSGHVALWVKAPPMVQEILVNADPKRFFVPPYLGPKGWVGVRLDYKVDWDELSELLNDAYQLSVPKRRRARVAASVGSTPRRATTTRVQTRARGTERPKKQPT